MKKGYAVEVVEFIAVEYKCPYCNELEYTEPQAVRSQRTCPNCKKKYHIPDYNISEDYR